MTIEEPVAVEQKWARISLLDRKDVQSMHDFAHHLGIEINELVDMQPKCWLIKGSYDEQFSSYKSRVDFAMSENRRALKILDDFSHVKPRLTSIQDDIEFLREWRTENEAFMDEYQRNYVISIIERLKILKLCFEQLVDEKIEGLEELRREFERNISILEPLGQRTHIWQPIETHTVTIRPAWVPSEWSSKEPRKAEVREFVSRRKCERCLKEEKVDFGSDLHF